MGVRVSGVGVASPVFSGMDAWSVFLSFLNDMFPNCKTADTTFNIPGDRERERERQSEREGGREYQYPRNPIKRGCLMSVLRTASLSLLTDDLLVGEAHDVHGVHGLLEVVLVLLARDRHVPIG